jgi:hypothetical protein
VDFERIVELAGTAVELAGVGVIIIGALLVTAVFGRRPLGG